MSFAASQSTLFQLRGFHTLSSSYGLHEPTQPRAREGNDPGLPDSPRADRLGTWRRNRSVARPAAPSSAESRRDPDANSCTRVLHIFLTSLLILCFRVLCFRVAGERAVLSNGRSLPELRFDATPLRHDSVRNDLHWYVGASPVLPSALLSLGLAAACVRCTDWRCRKRSLVLHSVSGCHPPQPCPSPPPRPSLADAASLSPTPWTQA